MPWVSTQALIIYPGLRAGRKGRIIMRIRRNEDTCIECGVTVVGNDLRFDSEGNCYCPECYQSVWGTSSYREEDYHE